MDLSSAATAFTNIEHLSYVLIFLIFIIEGPITNYVAAFAASLGIFNVFIILILAIMGNVIGDLILFFIGRIGKKAVIEKFTKSLHQEKLQKIKNYLINKPLRAFTIIKITPATPAPGLILAGTLDIKIKKFIFYSLIISTFYSLFFVMLGYYSGTAFNLIFKYFNYGAYIFGGVIILIIFSYLFFSSKIIANLDKIKKL